MKNNNKTKSRIVSVILAAILCLCLAGCSKAVLPEAMKDEFAACMSPQEIVKDIGKIKVLTKEDFEKLTPDDSGDSYTVKTKSQSGKEITLTYWVRGYDIDSITATTDDYSALYYLSDKKTPYAITVKAFRPEKPYGILEYVSWYSGEKAWLVDGAVYSTDEGPVFNYGFDYDYETEPLAENPGDAEVSDIGDMYYDAPLQFNARLHTLSYEKSGSDVNWYFTAAFIIQFENMEAAESFAEKYNTPKPYTSSLDGETPEITTENYTLKIAPEFAASEDFINFVSIKEFNDDYSLRMELNDKNEIIGFDTGSISFY